MQQRMAKLLKERYSNLGLPENVLNLVAGSAIIGLDENATDEVLATRASEKRIEDMLKGFQAHADKRATDAAKAVEDKNKANNHPIPPKEDEMPAWAKTMLENQKTEKEALLKRLDELENKNKTATFDEVVAKYAKEFNLEGDLLGLCKAGLSPDMTDQEIHDALGKSAKILADKGASLGGGGGEHILPDKAAMEQMRQEEADWVKAHAVKSEGE